MAPDPKQIKENIDAVEYSGDGQTLLINAHDAVEKARRFDPMRLPQSLSTYVRLLIRDNQYALAREMASEILDLEKRTRNAVEAYISLGICAGQANQIDEAERFFQQAADLSRKINYPLGLAQALQFLARMVLIVRGKFQLALTLVEETSQLREQEQGRQWNELFLRGFIYQTIGDRRHCRQVLDELVLQVEPGTRLAASYYFLWARLAIDEEELEQAREYLRLGLRVANRVGSIDLNLWMRLEYSRYHRYNNEASTARAWAEDALHQAQQYGLLYFIGLALIEVAQTHWDSGDRESAEANLNEALRVLSQIGAQYDLDRARFLRALWYYLSENPKADTAWMDAATYLIRDGYAFILENEQDLAFPLIAAHLRSKNPEVRQVTEGLMRHLANVPPPPLRVATLGQFAVWKGRRQIPSQSWNRRKAGELFRYLLLQPGKAAGREVIIEALWPEHPSDNLSDLLHQSTSALRHALEPDLPDKFPSRYLKVEGEHVALSLPSGSVVDFEHFERTLPLAIQARSIERLHEALNLYSGELFPSDRYNDWSAEKRQELADLHQRGMLALAQANLAHAQYYEVINCCRQILLIDTWNEDAVLLSMQAYAGLQDAPHALLLYIELEKTLQKELGIKPRSDLRELAAALRSR